MIFTCKRADALTVLSAACLALAAASAHAAPADPKALQAAAAAVGCEVEPGNYPQADLQKWPDANAPALQVVASLVGPDDEHSLGRLCVGVIRQDGGRAIREAVLMDVIRPPKKIDPVSPSVQIDTVPFQFSPSETAIAVWVEGSLDTQSVGYDYSTLYLFRRQGGHLVKIFDGLGHEVTTDKTGKHYKETSVEYVVKFSPHVTNGAYDLILARKHGGKGRRYIWTGEKYAPA
jgi:hypothetical protein